MFVDSIYPESNWFIRHAVSNMIDMASGGAETFVEKLIHKASKVIFILIPLFALMLKLFYLRRKQLFYNHLIFSIHLHAFLFLILLLYALIGFLPIDIPVYAITSLILLYLYLALKKVYRQSYLKTAVKFFLITCMYLVIAIPIFAVLLITFSAIF